MRYSNVLIFNNLKDLKLKEEFKKVELDEIKTKIFVSDYWKVYSKIYR